MKTFLLIVASSILCLQMPTYVYCQENSIIGEWELVSQSPSKKELMVLSMKTMGKEDVDPDTVVISEPSQEKLIITENAIKWISVGGVISGSNEQPYKLEGNKIEIVLDNTQDSPFANYAKQFTPEYYFIKFDDNKLVLTSSAIPGYENRTITAVYKRIK